MTRARLLFRAATAHGLARLRRRPHLTCVTLFLTLRCNCSCGYCDFPRLDRGLDWDGERFLRLLAGLARHGTARVGLSGGEPLLHPDFEHIARAAAEHGFLTSLVTNGILLEAHQEAASRLDYVLCTIEGDAAHHDAIRGPGAHGAAMRGLDALSRGDGPRLGVICPVHEGNAAQVEEVLRIAEALHARAFFQPVQIRTHWNGASAFDGVLADDATREVFHRLRGWRRAGRPVGNSMTHLRWVTEGFPRGFEERCFAGRYFHTILPDGALLPCCMVDWDAHRSPLDPDHPEAALGAGSPRCAGCSILPYVDNNLLLRPSPRVLGNALRW
ncbi:MAG: radical SAM protein [Pseudomonadota bacterium]